MDFAAARSSACGSLLKGEAPGSDTRLRAGARAPGGDHAGLVVAADVGFGLEERLPPPGEYLPVKAQATFGIASDGVASVILEADDGAHDALIDDNAFLSSRITRRRDAGAHRRGGRR